MAHVLTSGELYNFNLQLTKQHSGQIDATEFRKKLVTGLRAPITGKELNDGRHQQLITAVRVFVLVDRSGKPLKATFLKRSSIDNKYVEYVAQLVDGQTHLVGSSALTIVQEDKLFADLIAETAAASPFDDLGKMGSAIHNVVAELEPDLRLKKKPEKKSRPKTSQ